MRDRAGALQFSEHVLHRGNRGEDDPVRIDRDAKAEFAEFVGRQIGCLAAGCHIVEQRHAFEVFRHAVDLGAADRRFDKQHVGAGFAITLAALQRCIDAFDRNRVGARDDHEVLIASRIARRFNFRHHLRGRNHAFTGEMAATLGPALVFDVHAGDTGFFVVADGAARVNRIAVAGVGIGYHGKFARIDDAACVVDHLGCGQQADVRHAEACDAGAEARHISGFESRQFDEPRGEAVCHTGCDETAGA